MFIIENNNWRLGFLFLEIFGGWYSSVEYVTFLKIHSVRVENTQNIKGYNVTSRIYLYQLAVGLFKDCELNNLPICYVTIIVFTRVSTFYLSNLINSRP